MSDYPDEEIPRRCGLCDGTGWMETTGEVEGYEFVRRCRCYRPRIEHRGGCTCSACHYGADEAARIRRGNRAAMQAKTERTA